VPGYAYAILAVSLWGLNFVLLKVLVGVLPPHAMNTLRTLVAASGFLLLYLRGPKVPMPRGDALRIVAFGFIGNGLFQWLLMEGVLRTPAGIAAVANATNPAWLALLGYLFLKERLTALGYLGIALAALGVLLLGGGGGGEVGIGVVFLVLASLAWAVYSLSARTVGARYPLSAWVGLGYVVGMLPYWAWNVPSVATLPFASLPAWVFWGVAASGLLANVVAYLAWMRAVQLLGASRAGVWQNLAPLIGAIGGYVFLGERLSGQALLGGALVLLGVTLTQRARVRGAAGSERRRGAE